MFLQFFIVETERGGGLHPTPVRCCNFVSHSTPSYVKRNLHGAFLVPFNQSHDAEATTSRKPAQTVKQRLVSGGRYFSYQPSLRKKWEYPDEKYFCQRHMFSFLCQCPASLRSGKLQILAMRKKGQKHSFSAKIQKKYF